MPQKVILNQEFRGLKDMVRNLVAFYHKYLENSLNIYVGFNSSGSGVGDFRPMSNMDLQYAVLSNGSISISPAANHHEGQYMCRAENGIGRGLSKIITVSVNGKIIKIDRHSFKILYLAMWLFRKSSNGKVIDE